LDQLTKEFFNNDFPGYRDKVILSDDVLSINVPIAELEVELDYNKIFEISKKIEINEGTELHSYYRKDNYSQDKTDKRKRVVSCQSTLLWSDGKVRYPIKNVYYNIQGEHYPIKEPDSNSQLIKKILETVGIKTSVCWLQYLDPNGEIRPHRDFKMSPKPLDYFWIPLNYVTNSYLKSYPYGKVDVSMGNVYLLNNDYYVHSVYNGSNTRRFVLLGYLDHNLDTTIKNKIKKDIIVKYNV